MIGQHWHLLHIDQEAHLLTMPTKSDLNEAHPTAASTATSGNNGGGGGGGGALLAATVDPNPSIPKTCEPFIPLSSEFGCCAGEHCKSQSNLPLVYSKDTVPGASTHFCNSCGGLYHCLLLCGEYVQEVKGILDVMGIKFDPHLLSPRGQYFYFTMDKGEKMEMCHLCIERCKEVMLIDVHTPPPPFRSIVSRRGRSQSQALRSVVSRRGRSRAPNYPHPTRQYPPSDQYTAHHPLFLPAVVPRNDQSPPSDEEEEVADEEAQRRFVERFAHLPVLHTNNPVTPTPVRTSTRLGVQAVYTHQYQSIRPQFTRHQPIRPQFTRRQPNQPIYAPPVHAHNHHWYSAPPVYTHQHRPIFPNGNQFTQSYYDDLYYNNHTMSVNDISNLSSNAIRLYIYKKKYTYQHGGDLHNLHRHVKNVRLSVNKYRDRGLKCALCDEKRLTWVKLEISLGLCRYCYRTYVTNFSYEEILAKEIYELLPEFNRNGILPVPTAALYELDLYRIITSSSALESIEIDGPGHVIDATNTNKLYCGDALRSKHISEENDIHVGGCIRLLRIFHGRERVPSSEDLRFVIDLLRNEFTNVPGGYDDPNKDLVLLLHYDINEYRANLQVRRWLSIFGPDVVRVLRYDGTHWVNVDLTSLLHNQIMGK